jgi:hypothetical protein
MARSRARIFHWRQCRIQKRFDIRKLRPATLKRGQRFETKSDAMTESERRGQDLRGAKLFQFEDSLRACRKGSPCDKPFCPVCARKFRVWFVAETLKILEQCGGSAMIVTIHLQTASRDDISFLDPKHHFHWLRKKLERSPLKHHAAIGGVKLAYKAKRAVWLLHINLIVPQASEREADAFKKVITRSKCEFRPVVPMAIEDQPRQCSYALKFSTYHRPLTRTGSRKSPAVPLNPRENGRLIEWYGNFEFRDFVFLYRSKIRNSRIELNFPE